LRPKSAAVLEQLSDAKNPRFIATLARRGYRLIAPINPMASLA
jgi:DNA-binding winged helix-turn-helix (wHTH) protein